MLSGVAAEGRGRRGVVGGGGCLHACIVKIRLGMEGVHLLPGWPAGPSPHGLARESGCRGCHRITIPPPPKTPSRSGRAGRAGGTAGAPYRGPELASLRLPDGRRRKAGLGGGGVKDVSR